MVSKMKLVTIGDEFVVFDNGTTMRSEHYSDCCEWHWAEMSKLAEYNLNPKTGETIDIKEIEFPDDIENHLELIKDEGFNMIAADGSKYFVPCYGENNGYYGTDLFLDIVREGSDKVRIDLTEYQEIHWC